MSTLVPLLLRGFEGSWEAPLVSGIDEGGFEESWEGPLVSSIDKGGFEGSWDDPLVNDIDKGGSIFGPDVGGVEFWSEVVIAGGFVGWPTEEVGFSCLRKDKQTTTAEEIL